MNPRTWLAPIAEGLIRVYFRMVDYTSDTQRSAEWTVDYISDRNIPSGYVGRLRIDLLHRETPRAGQAEKE